MLRVSTSDKTGFFHRIFIIHAFVQRSWRGIVVSCDEKR